MSMFLVMAQNSDMAIKPQDIVIVRAGAHQLPGHSNRHCLILIPRNLGAVLRMVHCLEHADMTVPLLNIRARMASYQAAW